MRLGETERGWEREREKEEESQKTMERRLLQLSVRIVSHAIEEAQGHTHTNKRTPGFRLSINRHDSDKLQQRSSRGSVELIWIRFLEDYTRTAQSRPLHPHP